MHIFCATRIGGYIFLQHCSSGGGHNIFDHQIGAVTKTLPRYFRKFMTPLFQRKWCPPPMTSGSICHSDLSCKELLYWEQIGKISCVCDAFTAWPPIQVTMKKKVTYDTLTSSREHPITEQVAKGKSILYFSWPNAITAWPPIQAIIASGGMYHFNPD